MNTDGYRERFDAALEALRQEVPRMAYGTRLDALTEMVARRYNVDWVELYCALGQTAVGGTTALNGPED